MDEEIFYDELFIPVDILFLPKNPITTIKSGILK